MSCNCNRNNYTNKEDLKDAYHAAPWPVQNLRTQYDQNLMKNWDYNSVEKFQPQNQHLQQYINKSMALGLQDPDNCSSFGNNQLYKY